MAVRTIKHVSYWFREPIPSPRDPEKTILRERRVARGTVVDIPRKEDIERGEAIGAFEPTQNGESAEANAEEVPVSDMTDAELIDWIKEDKPTVPEVVAAAEGDPDQARRLLDAEDKATGGNSRQGVINGLSAIVSQAQ